MKYASPTDEYLHRLTLDGNFPDSGEAQAPTGWFAAVSLPWGTAVDEELLADIDGLDQAPIGHYLVREDDQGFIAVTGYVSEAELTEAYDTLDTEYAAWNQE